MHNPDNSPAGAFDNRAVLDPVPKTCRDDRLELSGEAGDRPEHGRQQELAEELRLALAGPALWRGRRFELARDLREQRVLLSRRIRERRESLIDAAHYRFAWSFATSSSRVRGESLRSSIVSGTSPVAAVAERMSVRARTLPYFGSHVRNSISLTFST